MILFCSHQILAQTVADVLENGEPVKKGYRIFLKYDVKENILKADVAKTHESADFTTLEDSIIFLVHKNAINVYLRPLNPINYSYSSETTIILDPINEAAEKALEDVINVLSIVSPAKKSTSTSTNLLGINKSTKNNNLITELMNYFQNTECVNFWELKTEIEEIQKELLNTQKEAILKNYNHLKSISFQSEQETKDELAKIKTEIKAIENHFNKVDTMIINANSKIKNLNCDDSIDVFTYKYIFNDLLKDLTSILEMQKKRLANLQSIFKLVNDMQILASIGGGTDELKWCIPLKEIPAKGGKISIFKVTIKGSAFYVSQTNQEILETEAKDTMNRTIRIRKFQRFVPEVSVGTAFTFLKYNTYGTISDSTGQQFVGSPTENKLSNLNITTMLNYNYFIPNSPIHPFYQLGVGLNSGLPTILTGLGIRSNINGIRRITISGGIAMTWIKELNELKVGDKISGTNDIEKDFKYSNAPKFTPYVGLQYNF